MAFYELAQKLLYKKVFKVPTIPLKMIVIEVYLIRVSGTMLTNGGSHIC